ncbi:MAG: YraN family protein [Nitrososphaeria archaeon]
MPSGEERWRSSERIAARILEDAGFIILEEHHRIMVDGVEVGEVDLVAERDGRRYAVEVKAGRLDVGGIRQAYVNAGLMGAEPLVVCKGFSDSSAEALAGELGIGVLRMSDLFIVEQEELEALIREVMEDALGELVSFLASDAMPSEDDRRILRAIAGTGDIVEAAGELGMEIGGLARAIEDMRSRGVLPRWARKYGSVRRAAEIEMAKERLGGALSALRGEGRARESGN